MKIQNVAAIVAAVALSAAASAQGRPQGGPPGGGMGRGGGMMGGGRRDPKEMAEMQTKMMTQMLALNPAQQSKVKAIVLKAAMDMKRVRDAQNAALKKVLTPAQLEKMGSMRGGGGRGGAMGGRPRS